jgi:hypothetical protein
MNRDAHQEFGCNEFDRPAAAGGQNGGVSKLPMWWKSNNQEVSFMKHVMLVVLCILALAVFGMAQGTYVPSTDVLGAHNNGGRGCAGCHAPHSGAFGAGGNGVDGTVKDVTYTGKDALFGQDLGPLYGYTLSMGDGGGFVEVLPQGSNSSEEETRGITMCLSCHDGNIAKGAMMTGVSYEQSAGLLPAGRYGTGNIPTWLGKDGTPTDGTQYYNDHPVGVNANLGAAHIIGAEVAYDLTGGTINSLTITGNHAQFEANYGFPSLRKGTWSWPLANPAGNTDPNKLFLLCTTCHNQHLMNVYGATYNAARNPQGAKIAGTTGQFASYWFVNAPYDMGTAYDPKTQAPSTTQFCRQCHFGEANENFGLYTIKTKLQGLN